MHTGKARLKRREEIVAQLFQSRGVAFEREFTVRLTKGPQKTARLDFRIVMPWGWLVFEVDEMQHSQYPVRYEAERMAAVYEEFARKHDGCLHFVRYNPDPWKQDGRIVKPSAQEREASILHALRFVPQAKLTITFLYYRASGDLPDIVEDPGFALKAHVMPQRCIEDGFSAVRPPTS